LDTIIELKSEIERLRSVISKSSLQWHPWYGPCDGLADGDCAECKAVLNDYKMAMRVVRAAHIWRHREWGGLSAEDIYESRRHTVGEMERDDPELKLLDTLDAFSANRATHSLLDEEMLRKY